MTAPSVLLPRRTAYERAVFPLTSIQQKFFGAFLFLHGLAHAGIGMWAGETGRWWAPVAIWELAMLGFIAAGLGAVGVSGLREYWRPFTVMAAVASLVLLLIVPTGVFVIGLSLDFMAIALVAYSRNEPATADVKRGRGILRLTGIVISWAFLFYVALVLMLRPWNLRWGTSGAELAMALPGDQFVPVANYRIDHAVTINAPVDEVWPWLIQIGQDRAGFYSYSKLENAIGARITNADRIVPGWQDRGVGELVRTVPSNWMRGAFGKDIGSRVLQVVPTRALVLDGWGAFVLRPSSANTTRLLVRTRGNGVPSVSSLVTAPFGLLVFEPSHFVMQRGMLLGIKERAERAYLEHTLVAS